jgi:hypothetical protein
MDRVQPRILSEEDLQRKKLEDAAAASKKYQEQLDREGKKLNAQKLHDRAALSGSWIYDPKDKVWYTPVEFLHAYAKYFDDHELFHRVKVMHPDNGVHAGYKQLEALQEKLKAFTLRVIEYYRAK